MVKINEVKMQIIEGMFKMSIHQKIETFHLMKHQNIFLQEV